MADLSWKNKIKRMLGFAPPPPVSTQEPSTGVKQSGGFFSPDAVRARQEALTPKPIQRVIDAMDPKKRKKLMGQ